MRPLLWSTVLQFTRLGIGAVLFLISARYLSLAQIGAFAAALAPVRILAVIHRPGIADATIAERTDISEQNHTFMMSFGLGLLFSTGLYVAGGIFPTLTGQMMQVLALLPLLYGLAAPSEAQLRGDLRIKALALRSLIAQVLAAALALWLLHQGAGAWALVAFAVTNTALGTALALWLAPAWPRTLPCWADLKRLSVPVSRIAARELANGATFPLLQLLVTAVLGLTAGGAFQIAARLLALIDTLAVAPVRYIALPKFAQAASRTTLPNSVLGSLKLTSLITCLIYPGAIISAPELLVLTVGPAHAAATVSLIPAFGLFGMTAALMMPLTQGLTAVNQTQLPLYRSLATLAVVLVLAMAGVSHSLTMTAAALPLGSGLVLLLYSRAALPRLGLTTAEALPLILPPMLAGSLMALALATLIPPLPAVVSLVAKVGCGTALYAALLLFFGWLNRQRIAA